MTSRMLPSLSESRSFDYSSLDTETRNVVQQKTFELRGLIRRSAQYIIEIGQTLIEIRGQLGYGSFRKWLKAEFSWSVSAATKFIQVAEQFSCVNFTQVEIAASALYLLARPSTPEEARQEALERANQGEIITHALAKQIRFHHTIDVKAETIENDEETSELAQAPPEQEPLPQFELWDESFPLINEIETIAPSGPKPQVNTALSYTRKGLEDSPQIEPALTIVFRVGARVRILRRQHGGDNWAGKTARIWQVTPDGHLQVDVEGHLGVRFTLHPDWVERMPEEIPEQHNEQLGQVLSPSWADEPHPESPTVTGIPPIAQREDEAVPHVQPGDRVFLGDPNQQGQRWMGEVAEVIEAAEDCIKLIVELRPSR